MINGSFSTTLSHFVSRLLHANGFFLLRSSDMDYWSNLMESHGAWVNPHLYPGLFNDKSEFLALFEASGSFAATIAWRSLNTDSYADLLKTGHAWSPEPEALGWTDLDLRGGEEISGFIHSRGGLWRRPDLKDSRLSWFLTSIQWSIALDEGVDFVVSQAKPDVADGGLTQRLYGYAKSHMLPPHYYPWVGSTFAAELVWSDAEAIRDEVSRRIRFLRQCHTKDLRSTVNSFERFQQSEKRPEAVRTPPVNERKPFGPQLTGAHVSGT